MRYAAKPCDDENGRTWDVMLGDKCVESCIPTRAAARARAKELNAAWPPRGEQDTGQRQRELAAILEKYASQFSPGELRAAIRLGAPDALEGECPICDTKLRLYCPRCSP